MTSEQKGTNGTGADEKGSMPTPEASLAVMDESFTQAEERQLVRKIDRTILPMMAVVFFLQYLDKQSLSYTAIFGLETDLHLTSLEYSWCSSIFYVGQLVSEYPFIYLMSRFHLSRLVGVTVIVWGAICMCLAAPSNFAGFAAVRFLLGVAEGAASPAFVSMTSIWYRKEQHATRVAIWITMNGVAQVVGCLLIYGIARNSSLPLAVWRTMFLVCGALTMGAGTVFYFFMPSGPGDAWFLTRREKHVLSLRMSKDREGGDKTCFSMTQFVEAMTDIKCLCAFLFGLFITMASPALTFASLIIEGTLGYSSFETILYTAPSGAVQIAVLWLGVLGCHIWPRQRTAVAMILVVPPLIANCLLLKLDESAAWGVIAASWIASCLTAPWSILLSLTASNVKGNTKRSTTNALFFIGYCTGCIAAPQLWTHKPRYTSGVITNIVIWVLLFLTTFGYRSLCIRSNQEREIAAANDGGVMATSAEDLTDKGDQEFRHSH